MNTTVISKRAASRSGISALSLMLMGFAAIVVLLAIGLHLGTSRKAATPASSKSAAATSLYEQRRGEWAAGLNTVSVTSQNNTDSLLEQRRGEWTESYSINAQRGRLEQRRGEWLCCDDE